MNAALATARFARPPMKRFRAAQAAGRRVLLDIVKRRSIRVALDLGIEDGSHTPGVLAFERSAQSERIRLGRNARVRLAGPLIRACRCFCGTISKQAGSFLLQGISNSVFRDQE